MSKYATEKLCVRDGTTYDVRECPILVSPCDKTHHSAHKIKTECTESDYSAYMLFTHNVYDKSTRIKHDNMKMLEVHSTRFLCNAFSLAKSAFAFTRLNEKFFFLYILLLHRFEVPMSFFSYVCFHVGFMVF